MIIKRNILTDGLVILAVPALLSGLLTSAFAGVVIPGLIASELEPELKGAVLIEELNCAACHAGDAALAERSKKAPRLAEVGSRVNPKYLESFIRDPHAAKPGTTMPDPLTRLGDEERGEAALSITHFLLSLKRNDFAPEPPDAVAAKLGERLFHSRGCAACHSPRDAAGTELLPETSAPLGALEGKYSVRSLIDFLREPHVSRPSGRMPDMRLAGRDLERIAHYLLRETRVPGHLAYTMWRGTVWEGLESDGVEAERGGYVEDFAAESLGKLQHHTALKFEGWLNVPHSGRYTFFLEMNGGSLRVDGREVVAQDPSDRRGVRNLEGSSELAAGWRRIELIYFHTGEEPKFSLTMEGPQFARQPIPPAMLSVSNEPIPAFEPLSVDPGLAVRGREMFGALGCANCHDDLGVAAKPATPLAKLDASRGCLSEAAGAWPRFDLNGGQRDLIAKALPRTEKPLDDRQRLNKTLVTFNCIACHERDGLGGIAPGRNAYFTGTHGSLGDQGRLPPPLSHVGAKLRPEWIAEVLLRGKRQRDYLDAAMPQFGAANVGHLVDLFGRVDSLEEVTFPRIA
ncbi:MAG: c-type cytochrome, partial [Verrucomicrobiaceae bacterium]